MGNLGKYLVGTYDLEIPIYPLMLVAKMMTARFSLILFAAVDTPATVTLIRGHRAAAAAYVEGEGFDESIIRDAKSILQEIVDGTHQFWTTNPKEYSAWLMVDGRSNWPLAPVGLHCRSQRLG